MCTGQNKAQQPNDASMSISSKLSTPSIFSDVSDVSDSAPSEGRSFLAFQKNRLWKDQPTDGWTDGRTDTTSFGGTNLRIKTDR